MINYHFAGESTFAATVKITSSLLKTRFKPSRTLPEIDPQQSQKRYSTRSEKRPNDARVTSKHHPQSKDGQKECRQQLQGRLCSRQVCLPLNQVRRIVAYERLAVALATRHHNLDSISQLCGLCVLCGEILLFSVSRCLRGEQSLIPIQNAEGLIAEC